jgi:molecular chaperone GrpE
MEKKSTAQPTAKNTPSAQSEDALQQHLENVADLIDAEVKHNHNASENLATQELQAEITKLKDTILRMAADKDNMAKRYEKQILDSSKYAISSFLKDLLPAIDNLYRASDSINNATTMNNPQLKVIVEGIEMTKSDFIKIFEKHGLIRVEPRSGDSFNHNFHQAVATVADSQVSEGHIVNVMQAGYELAGRLIRPAIVTVAKNGTN